MQSMSKTGDGTIISNPKKPTTRNTTRKKLPLDFLLTSPSQDLLKGYTYEDLQDLQDKVQELEEEILQVLNYDTDVEEVIGARERNGNLWFYVRWDGGHCSFVPAKVLNRIVPEKVIKYYEARVQIKRSDLGENTRKILGEIRSDNLPMIDLSQVEVQSTVPQEHQETTKEQRERERPRLLPPQPKRQKTESSTSPHSNINTIQKTSRTMNCMGCCVLLQYPEGTKAIKCPSCGTVMQAR